MSRIPAYDPTRIPFQKADGTTRPEAPYDEAGTWHDNTSGQSFDGCMEVLTQVIDYELTGADPSTGEWVVTLTPILDALGNAATNGGAPTSVSFTAAATSLANVVLGLIDALETAAGLTTPEELASWTRFRSYVSLSVSPTAAEVLRATATSSGATFSISITFDGDESQTTTAIVTPGTDVTSAGVYVALDADRSGGAYNEQGQPFYELITTGASAANFLGPVMLAPNTRPLTAGARYQTYAAGRHAPLAVYGHPRVYANKAIPKTSINTRVYVQRAAAGGIVAGSVTDAAGAAVGATADVWTGTPTAVNDTEYIFEIAYQGTVVQITVLGDASATATEISNAARLEIAKYNATVGQPLYGIAASGTSTIVLTGPADGRGFTPSQVAASAGTIAWVHTTTAVATHLLHPRGDYFLAASPAPGSVPIAIPHP